MWKRLIKSPLLERLRKLEDAAEELGISLQFNRSEIFLVDRQTGKTYHFLDNEADVNHLGSAASYIYEFPSQLEYKLCCEEEDETDLA